MTHTLICELGLFIIDNLKFEVNEMKKFLVLTLAAIIAILCMGSTLAQDSGLVVGTAPQLTDQEAVQIDAEAIDGETEEETDLISESGLGAEVRILQLRKAIMKNYIIGQEVVNLLKVRGENVTELEGILAEISLLKDEVGKLDPNSANAVESFVNIKRDARQLSQDFRGIAQSLLTADDKQAIAEALKANEELSNINPEIRNAVQNLNAQRVQNALQRMGAQDDGLVERIRSGNATKMEIINALKNAYNSLSDEGKTQARQRIKELIQTRKELRANISAKIKAEHFDVRMKRALERLNKLPVKVRAAAAKARIQNMVDKLKDAKQRLSERIDARNATLSNIKAKIMENQKQLNQEIQKRREEIKQRIKDRNQSDDVLVNKLLNQQTAANTGGVGR